MWNVDVSKMCKNHLLGEHLEMHMFVGSINKGTSMDGYLEKGLLEIHNLKNRHKELVTEMLNRGYVHKSPLPALHKIIKNGIVDIEKNKKNLHDRCKECKF